MGIVLYGVASHEGSYDHVLVNDDLEEAYGKLKNFLMEVIGVFE